MQHRSTILGLLTLMLLVLSGCGGSSSDPTPTPVPPEATATMEAPDVPTPTPENTPRPATGDPEIYPEPVLVARDAAAEEAGVSPDDVRVVSYQEREWASTALGCPRPGFSYAQVVTPGYQVEIQVGSTIYRYHTNLASNAVLCETTST